MSRSDKKAAKKRIKRQRKCIDAARMSEELCGSHEVIVERLNNEMKEYAG